MNILQQIQQESIKRELTNRLNFEKAEQNSLISQVQDDVLKGMSEEEILEKNRTGGYDLTKGKSMPIGTIHNGFKKIAEGKWRKVSNEGKTKEEYQLLSIRNNANNLGNEHSKTASKLDSKEYSDEEVGVKKSQADDLEKARSGKYADTPENRKLGRVGQQYGSKKEEQEGLYRKSTSESEDFKNMSFEDKKNKIIDIVKPNSNFKIENTDTRLLIQNKHRDSYIDIFPAERVLGRDDVKGNLWVEMFDKTETRSISLTDPRLNYQDTSARRVTHKKTDKRFEVKSLEQFEKEFKNFKTKVNF